MKRNRTLEQKVHNEIQAVKNAKKKQRQKAPDQRSSICPDTNRVIFDPADSYLEREENNNQETPMEVDSPSQPSTQQTRREAKFTKAFSSLSAGGKRRRTDTIYAMCMQYVEKENEDRTDDQEEFTINNLLGYLVKRANYHSDPKVAVIGKALEENQPFDQGHFEVDEAVALAQHLELSKEKQQILRNWMGKVNVKLPGDKTMLKTRK